MKFLRLVLLIGLWCMSWAVDSTDLSVESKAWLDAEKAMLRGPQKVKLTDKGEFTLAPGYAFIPAREANAIQSSMGNPSGPNMLGMVIQLDSLSSWYITLEYDESGHIKDDDQSDLDPTEILNSIKESQDEDNKRRKAEGFDELDIKGWVEAPAYDPTNHKLLWSLELSAKGDSLSSVNYNMKSLGREGLISATFVGTKSEVEQNRAFAKDLSNSITFVEGKRYTDFNSATDKIAEYGLMGLIGGVALKKLGLFAMIGLFFAKFFKIILIAVLALGGFLTKWVFRKKETPASTVVEDIVVSNPSPPQEVEPSDKQGQKNS